MSAEALDPAAAFRSVFPTPHGATPHGTTPSEHEAADPATASTPGQTLGPQTEYLAAVRGGTPALVVPALTRIDLVEPGPGDELVGHLDAVLAGLATGHAADDGTGRRPGLDTTVEELLRLFDAQAGSRWIEVAAHRLRAGGVSSAVPGPAGHELVAAVALATHRNDPALLPFGWRSFQLARGAHSRRTNRLSSGIGRALLDAARGLVGSAREPMGGSRNPIGGHPELAVLPHASTQAGHLPRAVGIAWTIGRQERLTDHLHVPLRWPDDALAIAGLDASAADLSVATGAIDAACRTTYQGLPLPLLLICADDATGSPDRTPPGWIAARFSHRAGLEYVYDNGSDPRATLRAAADAARLAREQRAPVLLHVRCARLAGQGPDRRDTDRDPIAATMRALTAAGALDADEVRRRWISIRDEVAASVEEALRDPLLGDEGADDVMAPLTAHRADAVADRAVTAAPSAERVRIFGPDMPENEGGVTLAQAINRTLADAGAAEPRLLVLGDGAAHDGGAHGITAGLSRRLGTPRVIDTLPDARTILGMALGAGVCGLFPVAEIATPSALHSAADQLRGEAVTAAFSSRGACRNPLVVRVPGLAHRPEHAGPVGIDHTIGALRDVPGLVVACPAHPADAPAILRTCLAAAAVDGTVSVVLEPVDLYHERDLLVSGDGGWLAAYHPPPLWEMAHVPIGRASTWGSGTDITVVTYGHGLRSSLRVAARLARASVGVRVVDLRWLAPLPVDDVLREATATGRCLIVDEARRSGGVSQALVTAMLEAGYTGLLARINADDSLVPPGPAAGLLLVSEADIEDAVRTLLGPAHPAPG